MDSIETPQEPSKSQPCHYPRSAPLKIVLNDVLNVFDHYPGRTLWHPANRELPVDRIAKEKLALIATAKTQVGLDEDGFADLLFLAEGVRCASELGSDGFLLVMRGLCLLGFAAPGGGEVFGQREGMATDVQVTCIRALWHRHAPDNSAQALDAWLGERYGVSSLRFCGEWHARLAIEELPRCLE